MNLPFVHHHRVTYAECTVGDHIYHSRYLDLLEAARGEFLRAAQEPLRKWQDRGYAFPVIECRLRFERPARYDDVLALEVRLFGLKGVRMNFAYRIHNQRAERILEGETFHVCADLSEKPKRLRGELLSALQACVQPDFCLGEAL